MTLLGFFATIIICGTILGCVWLIFSKPFTIIRVNSDAEEPQTTQNEEKLVVEGFSNAQSTPEIEQETAIVGMDAVIKAANAVMGIQSQEDSVNETRKE